MADEDIVFFLTPSGEKVSNDPRWHQQNIDKAREKELASVPNRGDMGITAEEQMAQTGQGTHAPQSGQPGVGEFAVEDDPDAYGLMGTSGRIIQVADANEAKNAGNTPSSPGVEAPEPEDSNEKVAKVRKAAQERAERAKKALDALAADDEEPGDPNEPYDKWTAKQLKAEALSRNAARGEDDQLDFTGVKKKSDLVELLERDDEAHADGN